MDGSYFWWICTLKVKWQLLQFGELKLLSNWLGSWLNKVSSIAASHTSKSTIFLLAIVTQFSFSTTSSLCFRSLEQDGPESVDTDRWFAKDAEMFLFLEADKAQSIVLHRIHRFISTYSNVSSFIVKIFEYLKACNPNQIISTSFA